MPEPNQSRHDQDEQRRMHATMLARLRAADFTAPQALMLADLRAHLTLVGTRLALEPAAIEPRRADLRATLSMLEIAIRAVAGASGADVASANGDHLAQSFGRFVAADLALLAERGADQSTRRGGAHHW